MDLHRIIGQNIRGYRRKAGLTQEALAAKVNMGSNHLARIERAEEGLTLERWGAICKVLGIEPFQLLKPDSYSDNAA